MHRQGELTSIHKPLYDMFVHTLSSLFTEQISIPSSTGAPRGRLPSLLLLLVLCTHTHVRARTHTHSWRYGHMTEATTCPYILPSKTLYCCNCWKRPELLGKSNLLGYANTSQSSHNIHTPNISDAAVQPHTADARHPPNRLTFAAPGRTMASFR